MNAWRFEPARDLDLSGLERHRSLHRENGLAASTARLAWWTLLHVTLPAWNRFKVAGRENLPAAAPFVLVANHCSHLDAPVLASLLPAAWRDRVFPVAACDTFFERRSTAALADWFLNALAIQRKTGRAHDLEDLRARMLEDPAVLIIFPEGTRSRTGALQPFRGGIGRLVAGTKVPVVPCHLDGCFRALPPDGQFIRPSRITVRVGTPRTFAGVPDDRAGWDRVASELQAAVAGLAPA